MTGYHIVITILDRSSPNSSRQILRGSSSTRSAGRTPHSTPTGLPGELDFEIANTPSFIPSERVGFWSDLSQAPTTRLGERWDNLEQLIPPSPTALWYEPDSILPASTSRPSFTPAPTLDYRFGPISLDWVDHPASHPAFSPFADSTDHKRKKSDVAFSKSKASFEMVHSNKNLGNIQHSARPSTSSLPPRPDQSGYSAKLNSPTAQFITESPDKAKYQLGSTNFGYGSIHLYRDFEEASIAKKTIPESVKSASHQKQAVFSQVEPNESDRSQELRVMDDNDGLVVGVLAIPSYMTSQDFLAFISSAVESVESVRMLRDSLPNRCIGLIKFRNCQAARWFASEFNGKPFSHLQDREICHTAFIRSVQFKSSLIPPFTFPALLPPDLLSLSAHELPTCPVCLERMDASVTGLMTKTCSHTFHCHCLSNWGDTRCPICRYSETKLCKPSVPDQSECAACGSQANLWICLICGHVGCGRYQGGHAYRHFEESAHLYALELGSQRVWDYVGDNYVHRLIQTKSDQIVELPALSSAVFDSGGGPGIHEAAHQSKIEAISEEFGHLVASQLDSQRAFYEEEMEIMRNKLESARQETEEQREITAKLHSQLKAIEQSNESLEKTTKKEKSNLAKKAEKTLQLSQRLESELKEEKLMSQGMRLQIKKLEEERDEEKKKTVELNKEIVDIKEQLRDLMFFLEMQSKIQTDQDGKAELQGGSIVVETPGLSSKPKSKGKKE